MKKLTCHCQAVKAEINVPDKLEKLVKCNCSICKKKGAIMSMVKNEDFKIIKGQDKLKLYQFHSNIAKHYFCTICGIYTHHNPRINPTLTAFNVGCIDDINTFTLNDIKIADGKNHPLDKKK
tara:strand:+ start:13 stop:378 length:366 start_codon:yes stop_codon:yes gene_type:complete